MLPSCTNVFIVIGVNSSVNIYWISVSSGISYSRVMQLRYCSMREAIAIVQHLIRGYFFRCDQSFIY